MGQKVNPNALRLNINRTWISKWEASDDRQTAKWIVEDEAIRKYFLTKYKTAQIVETKIERTQKVILVNVIAGQPGLIYGKNNANVNEIILAINKIVGRKIKVNFYVTIFENPSLSARLIAREIADSIENRVSFRVAQKIAIKKVMQAHAKGIKTNVSGRLGGVEMAREEGYSQGIIPLSTLRANIDYAMEIAHTISGSIGVKVWINHGDFFKMGKGKITKKHSTIDKKNWKPKFNPNDLNILKLPKETLLTPKTKIETSKEGK